MLIRKKVFISYRRADNPSVAHGAFTHLSRLYGNKNVFLDTDFNSNKFGVDFFDTIEERISSCSVFLLFIGTKWCELSTDNDIVKWEIELALENRVTIIPVYFDGANERILNDVPGLHHLSFINSVYLFHENNESVFTNLEIAVSQNIKLSMSMPRLYREKTHMIVRRDLNHQSPEHEYVWEVYCTLSTDIPDLDLHTVESFDADGHHRSRVLRVESVLGSIRHFHKLEFLDVRRVNIGNWNIPGFSSKTIRRIYIYGSNFDINDFKRCFPNAEIIDRNCTDFMQYIYYIYSGGYHNFNPKKNRVFQEGYNRYLVYSSREHNKLNALDVYLN